MDTKEKNENEEDKTLTEITEEFLNRMSGVLEKKMTMEEIHIEAEKIKKELKEKYDTPK